MPSAVELFYRPQRRLRAREDETVVTTSSKFAGPASPAHADGTVPDAETELVGAGIGFGVNAVVTLITKHYQERKSRREILVKTAWDYFSNRSDLAKYIGDIKMMQFELYIFYTVKVVELALRENLSNQEILDEMRKYHAFEKELTKIPTKLNLTVRRDLAMCLPNAGGARLA
jgi:hypothetical protein